jgi:DNA primase
MQIHDLNFVAVIIWLDPDEAGIEGAKKAYKKLKYFLPTTTAIGIYGCDKEPKECTPAELVNMLV